MKSLRIFYRFLKSNIEVYNNYKIEYVYSLLLLFPVLFPSILWYLIVGDGEIAGWGFKELLSLNIFYGVLVSLLDFVGFWNVWVWLEREGRKNLSLMLTKPINILYYLLGINLFPASLPKIAVYLLMIGYLALSQGFELSLIFILTMLFSTLAVLSFLMSIIAFMLSFDKSATPLMYVTWNFMRIGDLPINTVGGALGILLTYIFPVAFMAVVPAQALKTQDPFLLLSSIFVFIVMAILLKIVLRYSLERFEAIGG